MNSSRVCFVRTLLALAAFASAGSFAVAKPPKDQEPPKQPLPPNIKAAMTSQPAQQVGPPAPAAPHGAAPNQPPSPQPTVQLKPGEVPKIDFDTPTYDFGKVKTGKDIEHDFWFHNSGNGPLEIVQVKPS